eukprot:COSAG02_NODE_8124_length_2697_cov_1436.096228_2_plen_46_part_00
MILTTIHGIALAEICCDKRKYRVAAENADDFEQWLRALSAQCSPS